MISTFVPDVGGTWTFVEGGRPDPDPELDDRIVFERPGYGEPGATCGVPAPWFCPDHGVQWVPSSCRRRECPDCVNPWAWRAANRARERLAYGKKLYCIQRWGVRHVVVSFDDQRVPDSKVELDRQFRLVYRTVARMGLWGGLGIFHPWRKRCSECGGSLDCEAKKRCHPGAGLEWAIGPHFHVIGYGAVNASDRPRGAFVKSMPRRRSIAGTIKYALDHCGIPLPRDRPSIDREVVPSTFATSDAPRERKWHTLRWFGAWSYNAFPRDATLTPRRDTWGDEPSEKCPICGRGMIFVPDLSDRTGWPAVGVPFRPP